MKGTREQRIKRLEDSKQSFTSWVAALMQIQRVEKVRNRDGEDETRLWAWRKIGWAIFHKYEDGTSRSALFNTRHSKGLTMDPESLSVILPCWSAAIGLELLVVLFFVKLVKDKEKIISATYNVDVTRQLRSRVTNNKIYIRADNNICGDPALGKIKFLIVKAEVNGELVSEIVKEGDLLSLSEDDNVDRLGIYYADNNDPREETR